MRNNPDSKIPDIHKLPTLWGKGYQLWTLDRVGKFELEKGDQVYVMGGHGTPGVGVVFWGNQENWLAAETVAQLTAARFRDCGEVAIKVYSCHSAEGGYSSFATRFAPQPLELTAANVDMSKAVEFYQKTALKSTIPENYTGPEESVKKGETHRWSKLNTPMFRSRASEAREKVGYLKAEQGSVWQRWRV